MMNFRSISLFALLVVAGSVWPSDWPQFMFNAERTGDAADEQLKFPLKLVAQIKLASGRGRKSLRR